jgi:hypothetical protein
MKTFSHTTPLTAFEHSAAGDAAVVNGAGSVGLTGWAAQRLAVIRQASGLCARCGRSGADTAFRGWDSNELLAGHTRCVVGFGPAAPPTHNR